MKNFLELPRKEDFLKVTFLDINPQSVHHILKKEEIRYRKGYINLRNIVDFFDFELNLKVIDEEKFPAYEKEMKEFRHRNGYNRLSPFPMGGTDVIPTPIPYEPEESPVPPTKEIKLTGTSVQYFNGLSRITMEDFSEFKETYFEYLEKVKLDINL